MGRYDDDDYTPSGSSEETSEGSAPTITKEARRVVRGGWGNAQKQKAASSPFPQRLSPDKEGVVVKFLEDGGPYAAFRQHWINEIQEGTKAFTCIDGMDMGSCPLCDGGSRASSQFMFNVAELSKDGPAELKTYNVGITVFDQLSDHHTDERQGPLEKHYWVIKRSKNGTKWTTTLFMQRKDELVEQGYDVPSQEYLDSLKLWDDNEVRITPRETLLEIAAQYLDLE